MRFTELERSLLAVNAALVARLDLIEQGDDLADTIANDTATVADLRREANRRETELIDEREDLRKELQRVRAQRDDLNMYVKDAYPDSFEHWQVCQHIDAEQMAAEVAA